MVFGWMMPDINSEVGVATSCRVKQIIHNTIQSGELSDIPGVSMVDYHETSISPCYVEFGGMPSPGLAANSRGGGLQADGNGSSRFTAAAGISAAAGTLVLAFGAVYSLRKRRSTSSSHFSSDAVQAALWDDEARVVQV